MTVQSTFTRGPRSRSVLRVVGVASTVAGLVMAGTVSASAAPGNHSDDTTIANVQVTTAIVLSGLTPQFTLVGIPGATVLGNGEVTMNVATNNLAGYAVTVQATTPTLVATAAGNGDSIPIGALSVRETNVSGFTAMSDVVPATVHSQPTRSAQGGDTISNDYQVVIPFVNEDTYTTTLDYIATTL